MLSRIARLLPLALLAAAPAHAQTVSGLVRLLPAAAPAAHTVVLGIADSARIVGTTRTDATGVFGLDFRQPGTYRLLFVRAKSETVTTPRFTLDTTLYVEREFRIPGDTAARDTLFLASEVTVPAKPLPTRQPAPLFPDAERGRATQALVRTVFVVDSAGRIEKPTIAIVGAAAEAFVAPVLKALPGIRFAPARLAGRAVPQVVVFTFDFGRPGDPARGDLMIRAFTTTTTQVITPP